MEIVTIDGMVENDFRLSIEDMLRLDQVDEAIERLRDLMESTGCLGTLLPARFVTVSARDVEFGGWHRLGERLLDHDRRGFPITAIGVTLADARKLGGPGPANGRMAPFIKTFYFGDDAYPFGEATRDDLLDGYSRDGFELQGDYRATDATLSVRGIDDLYGAIVELEARLFDRRDPGEDEIRAGSIGACFLAALIHQALRDTIRAKGLPRALCVFAACDGVYPFFDAPVTGSDECLVAEPVQPPAVEATRTDEAGLADKLFAGASLLTLSVRRERKAPVMVLDPRDAEEAARYSETAAAQRMAIDDTHLVREALDCAQVGEPLAEPLDELMHGERLVWIDQDGVDRSATAAALWPIATAILSAQTDGVVPRDPAEEEEADGDAGMTASGDPDSGDEPGAIAADAPVEPPMGHSLRARIKLAQPDANAGRRGRFAALLERLRGMLLGRSPTRP